MPRPRYKPLSDDMVKLIMKKHEKGASVDEIAEAFEISKQRVTNTIRKQELDDGVKEVIVKLAYREPSAPLACIAQEAEEWCSGEIPGLRVTASMVNQVLIESGWKDEIKRRSKIPEDEYLNHLADGGF